MRGRLRWPLLFTTFVAACGGAGTVVRAPSPLSADDHAQPGTGCALAKSLRARVPSLRAEGRLDRARRGLVRACAKCPEQRHFTWSDSIAIAVELELDEEVAALAREVDESALPPDAEARRAARAGRLAIAERRARPRAPAAAQSMYLAAIAAALHGDDARARDRFLRAYDLSFGDGNALLGAALATKRLGDQPGARRLFDRVAVALERDARGSRPPASIEACGSPSHSSTRRTS